MGNQCATKVNFDEHFEHMKFSSEKQRKRFMSGKPILVQPGINVTINPETKALSGIPEEWVTNLKPFLQIDQFSLVNTTHLRNDIRAEEEFPQPIQNIITGKTRFSYDQTAISLTSYESLNNSTIQYLSTHQDHLTINDVPEKLRDRIRNSFKDSTEIIDKGALSTIILSLNERFLSTKTQKELLSTSQFQNIVKDIKFITSNPNKNFIFIQEIGHGGICKVYKAKSRGFNHNYAVRIMKQQNFETLSKIRSEIAVMQICQSANIVQHYFTFYYMDSLFMFIEYMDAGCLTKFIKKYKSQISDDIIALIVRQIVKGLNKIHSKKQIHRDIKSDNILLDTKGNIKIADFGYALQLTADKLNTNTLAGTTAWMAPQLIKKDQYDQKVDIWSLGILIVQFCQGEPPYLKMQPIKTMYKIATQPAPVIKNRSRELTNFAACCLKKNPRQRLNARQLLQHSFLRENIESRKTRQIFVKMIKDKNG